MIHPRRGCVKGLERAAPCLHVRKPAEPYEAVGVIEIAVVTDRDHPAPFLALDELTFEEWNEDIAPARVQSVTAQFDNT